MLSYVPIYGVGFVYHGKVTGLVPGLTSKAHTHLLSGES
jgi:hypothetical protein